MVDECEDYVFEKSIKDWRSAYERAPFVLIDETGAVMWGYLQCDPYRTDNREEASAELMASIVADPCEGPLISAEELPEGVSAELSDGTRLTIEQTKSINMSLTGSERG